MTSGTRSTDSKTEQKRRDYRVQTALELKFRRAASTSEQASGPNPVALFEELALAQTRFRKELGPAGRTFVDKLMATVDALTGLVADSQGAAGWGDLFAVDADLSAGGIGFTMSSSELAEGLAKSVNSEIELQFSLPQSQSTVPFRCTAEVLRCDTTADGLYRCGLSFTQLSATTQRRLIRVVLELQRAQLRDQGGTG